MANKCEPFVLDFPNGQRVEDILKKADQLPSKAQLDQQMEQKATMTDVERETQNLQNQINEIVRAPESGGDVAAEVAQARVGEDGTTYQTLKARLDAEDAAVTNIEETISDNSALIESRNLFNPDAATVVQDRLVTESISVIAGEKYYLEVNATQPSPMVSATFFGVYETINGVETLSGDHWISPYIVPDNVTSVRFIIQQKIISIS